MACWFQLNSGWQRYQKPETAIHKPRSISKPSSVIGDFVFAEALKPSQREEFPGGSNGRQGKRPHNEAIGSQAKGRSAKLVGSDKPLQGKAAVQESGQTRWVKKALSAMPGGNQGRRLRRRQARQQKLLIGR